MIRFAVIADPHVHDCDWKPAGTDLTCAIRSFAETADSTRIFNESVPAFRRALELAVEQGAKLALLVGDLTDDGQLPHIRRALALLDEFRQRHGLRILATPGNHDLFALDGRPMVKGLLTETGETLRLDSASCPEAACLGTLPALRLLAGLGYQPEPGDLHWESPFGSNPDWEARRYSVSSADGSASVPVIDASYLIEPIPGLWVLSLDSNVPVPRNGAVEFSDSGAWHDPTGNGWPAVLAHRPHLLPWMRDVATRAKALGKRLISFSHYPVLDALGISADEVALLGNTTGLACRAPGAASGEAFAATGVGLHISGHLHVNTTTRLATAAGTVVNIAAPSPVGFAPGIKIFDMGPGETRVRTLPLIEVPGHDLAYAAYQREAARAGLPPPAATRAPSHGAFLDAHLEHVVPHRYMKREWPAEMQDYAARTTLAQLLAALGITQSALPEPAMALAALPGPEVPRAAPSNSAAPLPSIPPISVAELVVDWYRLRKGGQMGEQYIAPERLAFYRALVRHAPSRSPTGPEAKFARLLQLMGDLLARLPDRDFRILGPDLRVLPV